MGNDDILTEEEVSRLHDIAEPIYREAVRGPFDLTLGGGWNVLEEDDFDQPIFYIFIRVDFADERHWFTRFKLPGVLENPESWFQADADEMKHAI